MRERARHGHSLSRFATLAADRIKQFDPPYQPAEREVPLADAMTLATVFVRYEPRRRAPASRPG